MWIAWRLLFLVFVGDLYIVVDYHSGLDLVLSVLLRLGSYLRLLFTSDLSLVLCLVFPLGK